MSPRLMTPGGDFTTNLPLCYYLSIRPYKHHYHYDHLYRNLVKITENQGIFKKFLDSELPLLLTLLFSVLQKLLQKLCCWMRRVI